MSAPSLSPNLELDEILVNDYPFLFPRYLRPIVGVDSTLGGMYFEAPAMRGLLASVSEGDTVYDVGESRDIAVVHGDSVRGGELPDGA